MTHIMWAGGGQMASIAKEDSRQGLLSKGGNAPEEHGICAADALLTRRTPAVIWPRLQGPLLFVSAQQVSSQGLNQCDQSMECTQLQNIVFQDLTL